MQPYLLEKNRVCMQASWERNFHVFYQLLRGADQSMVARYKLLDMRQYSHLNRFSNNRAVMDRFSGGPVPVGLKDASNSVVQFDVCDKVHFDATGQLEVLTAALA